MSHTAEYLPFPELIFGIAGPIGIDIDKITDALTSALNLVDYRSEAIKITKQMEMVKTSISKPDNKSHYDDMIYKMDYANEICKLFSDPAALAKIAIWTINAERAAKHGASVPEKTAYIIRQLKRTEEVDILRKVYGRQFILISAYGPEDERRSRLSEKLRKTLPTSTSTPDIAQKVEHLISRDASEEGTSFGQQLRDTFHLADVFIDGMTPAKTREGLNRFIQALFGQVDIAPTKIEYGMYAAKSASLRSSDLSRQVGAAIFSENGEIITVGCNEVPRAMGGAYWDGEEPDFRDIKLEFDPNEIMKKEILRDLVERLSRSEMLSEKLEKFGSSDEIVKELTRKDKFNPKTQGALVDAYIMDLTEYGRVVHAEMCAICDAARIGRSIKNSTIFVTTFPCHNCTKHIIASGVRKVIFMEPYPKSKAQQLHENEISIEKDDKARVSFLPFLGISPFRYRDIFQKNRRKTSDGKAMTWYGGKCRPQIDVVVPVYLGTEAVVALELQSRVTPANPRATILAGTIPASQQSSRPKRAVRRASVQE